MSIDYISRHGWVYLVWSDIFTIEELFLYDCLIYKNVFLWTHLIPFVESFDTFKTLVNKEKPTFMFHFIYENLKCVNKEGIKCAKNRNKPVNKGKQACKSSKRRETVPLQWYYTIVLNY